jgi:DNA-binding response OmpR family regulator
MASAEASLETASNSILPVTALAEAHGTILLVEDEAFVREVTCEILESAGYRVLKAQNAAEARITFQRYKKIVHLLVVDVVLPGQNGRDLVHELRTISPSLRAIFISGFPENAVTRHGLQEDGLFYLPKPFSGDSLTRKVNQVLEG